MEQHDPADLSTGAQPYAYVVDRVIRADLSIDVTEQMSRSLGVKAWDAMADLRDELAPDEKVGWFAVFNGDVEREDVGEGEAEGEGNSNEDADERRTQGSLSSSNKVGASSLISTSFPLFPCDLGFVCLPPRWWKAIPHPHEWAFPSVPES